MTTGKKSMPKVNIIDIKNYYIMNIYDYNKIAGKNLNESNLVLVRQIAFNERKEINEKQSADFNELFPHIIGNEIFDFCEEEPPLLLTLNNCLYKLT